MKLILAQVLLLHDGAEVITQYLKGEVPRELVQFVTEYLHTENPTGLPMTLYLVSLSVYIRLYYNFVLFLNFASFFIANLFFLFSFPC